MDQEWHQSESAFESGSKDLDPQHCFKVLSSSSVAGPPALCGFRLLDQDSDWEDGPDGAGRLHAAAGAHGARTYCPLCQRGTLYDLLQNLLLFTISEYVLAGGR